MSSFRPTASCILPEFFFSGRVWPGSVAARARARFHDLALIDVAALGLRADPREPFAKVPRAGHWVTSQVAGVWRTKTSRVLMFADPAKIDPLAIHLQAENMPTAPVSAAGPSPPPTAWHRRSRT